MIWEIPSKTASQALVVPTSTDTAFFAASAASVRSFLRGGSTMASDSAESAKPKTRFAIRSAASSKRNLALALTAGAFPPWIRRQFRRGLPNSRTGRHCVSAPFGSLAVLLARPALDGYFTRCVVGRMGVRRHLTISRRAFRPSRHGSGTSGRMRPPLFEQCNAAETVRGSPEPHSGSGSRPRVAGWPEARPELGDWRLHTSVPDPGSDPWVGL